MLYGYWDTVADRLFKIRHCMNIAGEERSLPLFAPPIDPALLVRASAAGLDIASIISGLYAPLPHYRFNVLLQKALEFCGEVRNLGGALLTALEKKDAEELSVLRSTHEVGLLQAVRALKSKSVEEAEASLEGLQQARESAEFRVDYYASRAKISTREQQSLTKQEDAAKKQREADYAAALAAFQFNIPMTEFDPLPSVEFGGLNLGGSAQAFSSVWRARASILSWEASEASTLAGYDRRQEDWDFQADLAQKEIEQLDKQILAADIRLQMAGHDLETHDKQTAQAEEVETFLQMKFSNQDLYSWMVTKLSTLHFEAYQLAYQIAQQAENAFEHELGPESTPQGFIEPTYWDSLKKGLLAGEQLSLGLRRMEAAYLDQNKREYELTKHVSMAMLDPMALLMLKETGTCYVTLPEALFDLDYPGHYMRRIKSVSLTIPAVTGPYTSVNTTLTLLGSSIRFGSDPAGNESEYARDAGDDDPRFRDDYGAVQSIATSDGQSDSGLFELNFRDERYLPFEGAGAISQWQLELPTTLKPFDYDTISDVILHVHYTARDGGSSLPPSKRWKECHWTDNPCQKVHSTRWAWARTAPRGRASSRPSALGATSRANGIGSCIRPRRTAHRRWR
jgi:hypothetical protein